MGSISPGSDRPGKVEANPQLSRRSRWRATGWRGLYGNNNGVANIRDEASTIPDLDFSTTPIPNPSVIFREGVDGWAVLVNMDTAASVALNPTGILVWKAIDGKRDVKSVVEKVKDNFTAVPDSVSDDVLSLIKILQDDGFVGVEVEG